MTWCVQCGAQSRPVAAIGYDEDGEPACVGHQVRAKKPLNVEEVQTSAPESQPTVVAVHSFPPEFKDVPSPGTETPAKEEVMRAKPAFAERKCACCGEPFIPTGATQRFAFGHKPKLVRKTKSAEIIRTRRGYRMELKEPLPAPGQSSVPMSLSNLELQLDALIPKVFAKILQGFSLEKKLALLESLLGY